MREKTTCYLLLLGMLLAPMARGEETAGVRPVTRSATSVEVTVTHTLADVATWEFTLGSCQYGAQQVPCCGYKLYYTDKTDAGNKTTAFKTADWQTFMSQCGEAIDDLQRAWLKAKRGSK